MKELAEPQPQLHRTSNGAQSGSSREPQRRPHHLRTREYLLKLSGRTERREPELGCCAAARCDMAEEHERATMPKRLLWGCDRHLFPRT